MFKKFRVSVYPAIGKYGLSKTFEFETSAEMESASNAMADLLLYLQDDLKIMEDYSNAFIEEEWSDKDHQWMEIDE